MAKIEAENGGIDPPPSRKAGSSGNGKEEVRPLPNLEAVARLAGVSISTVSRALSEKVGVSAKARERVLAAIEELDYSPNFLAQALKLGKTRTIALLVPSIQNEIFPVITRGVEDVARKYGYTVILCNTDDDLDVEKDYITKLRTRYIDGFIVASMLPRSESIRRLQGEGFPVVLLSRYYDEDIDAVIVDNYRAAFDGVSYLARTGCGRIAIACGSRDLSVYQQRYKGYVDALAASGLEFDPDLVVMEANGTNSFYYLFQGLLRKGVKLDAVFATSDQKALVIIRALKDFGLSIPGDVSLLGFDNIEMSAFVDPPLSTISQPLYEMGELGARKLIELIAEGPHKPRVDILGTDLIVRKSTR